MAVTATCSRKVLPDLLQTLQMRNITPSDGEIVFLSYPFEREADPFSIGCADANAKGTVFFDAPLYRTWCAAARPHLVTDDEPALPDL